MYLLAIPDISEKMSSFFYTKSEINLSSTLSTHQVFQPAIVRQSHISDQISSIHSKNWTSCFLENWSIQYYHRERVDVLSISPSSERMSLSDEGLMLKHQLSKTFRVVIQSLTTCLIKPNVCVTKFIFFQTDQFGKETLDR